MLFLSYVIGLMFTLRTHAAVIWTTELDEKKTGIDTVNASQTMPPHTGTDGERQNAARTDIRDTQLYQRILGQSLRQAGLAFPNAPDSSKAGVGADGQSPQPSSVKSPHIVPPKGRDGDIPGFHLQALSEEDNNTLTRTVAEIAATAAAAAARDATKAPRKTAKQAHHPSTRHDSSAGVHSHVPVAAVHDDSGILHESGVHASGGGHDAPNWSKTKSVVVLLVATLAYAVIAEILVDTVDAVLDNVDIDEKFLGITLFALVPNTTEFLVRLLPSRFYAAMCSNENVEIQNAISFAMNGNIALSMEIGSAYALQVCLLQIPAVVLYSTVWGRFINPEDIVDHTFSMIFPQWDMVTVILCVFLLSYMYGEGKSNYFKGSILILSYLVVVVGFYFAGYDADSSVDGLDTLALGASPRLRASSGFVMLESPRREM